MAPSAIRAKAKTVLIRDKIMTAVTQEIGGGAKGYTDYPALA